LSGGEKQRVAIARTILKNPPSESRLYSDLLYSWSSASESLLMQALSILAQFCFLMKPVSTILHDLFQALS